MKRAMVGAVLLGASGVFGMGYAIGVAMAERDPPQAAEAKPPEAFQSVPAAARKAWFPPVSEYDTDGGPLDDAKFNALADTLKEALAAEETLQDFEREAEVHLWSFIRRLAKPALSDEQLEKAKTLLATLADTYPNHRHLMDRQLRLVESYAEAMENTPPFSIFGGWFPKLEELDTDGKPFADETIERLMGILDTLLSLPETLADFENEVGTHLWRFTGRLQLGSLTESQTARIVSFLQDAKARHPEAGETIDTTIHQVRNLMLGQVAPNIVGTDSEGVEFSLEEYRGNIVALYFTGQWCGPCRREYPYQRFMLELYKDEPVTILGINSDEDIETLRDAKETEGLAYRSWWDGHGEDNTEGPIASAWNVTGWPTTYVLDEEGVIRSVNKRRAKLIAAVNRLLDERRMREFKEGRPAA